MTPSQQSAAKPTPDDLPVLDEVIVPGSALTAQAETEIGEALEPMIALSQLDMLVEELLPSLHEELEERMNQALDEELTRILTGAMEQLRQRLRERLRAELKLGLDDMLQGLLMDARQP